ncbi:MAG: carbon-nitrogen hydrolase family protein [Woeseiaceae bacterium]
MNNNRESGKSAVQRIAAIQMSSGNDLDENLRNAGRLLEEARASGCVLAVLPENFAFIGRQDSDKLGFAENDGIGPIQEFLARTAARHSMWIVAGSLPLKTSETALCYGASYVFDAEGHAVSCYRKIHLFDVDLPDRDESYRESASMDPGHEPECIDTPVGVLGLSICYDLRFPELYRRLVDEGAELFSIPAAFTFATGTAHWHTLLRARAIENLAYVIAAGQHGTHPNGRTTFGHSLIVDPWGRILAQQEAGDGVVVAEVDTGLPRKLRAEFPVLRHRRL